MNSSSRIKFSLPKILWEQIQIHLQANLPEEACGLIAGVKLPEIQEWRAQTVYPVENILHSPFRYQMDGHAQLAAFELIDQADQDLIAIFHSHPNGPTFPSDTDIKESYYSEIVHLICFQVNNQWQCRGYQLIAGGFHEINLILLEE